VGLSII